MVPQAAMNELQNELGSMMVWQLKLLGDAGDEQCCQLSKTQGLHGQNMWENCFVYKKPKSIQKF